MTILFKASSNFKPFQKSIYCRCLKNIYYYYSIVVKGPVFDFFLCKNELLSLQKRDYEFTY